jgi:hypothetical protein
VPVGTLLPHARLSSNNNSFNQEKRTNMSGESNDHATAHKSEGDTDFQELEEPETLDVVIDGADEAKRKQWRPRVLLAVFVLVVVSVALGVSFGLTANKNSPPAVAPKSVDIPTQPPSFMNGLPSYSLELASNNASSPQANALAWLRANPLYNEYEPYRLYQRYALAVLYYATNGTYWWYNGGWLSDVSECEWYKLNDDGPEDDYSCVEGSRLSFLDLWSNNLDGSIPPELELLADLEYMRFYDDTLSGTIHSEL